MRVGLGGGREGKLGLVGLSGVGWDRAGRIASGSVWFGLSWVGLGRYALVGL